MTHSDDEHIVWLKKIQRWFAKCPTDKQAGYAAPWGRWGRFAQFPAPMYAPGSLRYPPFEQRGELACWGLLRHFRMRRSVADIRKFCHLAEEDGPYPVAWAMGLRRLGLEATYHRNRQQPVTDRESVLLRRAEGRGMKIHRSEGLDAILRSITPCAVPVVFFCGDWNDVECSPLLGMHGPYVATPYSFSKWLTKKQFLPRWRCPGLAAQYVMVYGKG